MGVRIREELSQALQLNNQSHDKKRIYLDQLTKGRAKNFEDGAKLEH